MSQAIITLPIPMNLSSEGGLAAYVRAVNAAPMLSAEEERSLGRRFRNEGDLEAARQLVLSNLRYVVRVARGLPGGHAGPHGLAAPRGEAPFVESSR